MPLYSKSIVYRSKCSCSCCPSALTKKKHDRGKMRAYSWEKIMRGGEKGCAFSQSLTCGVRGWGVCTKISYILNFPGDPGIVCRGVHYFAKPSWGGNPIPVPQLAVTGKPGVVLFFCISVELQLEVTASTWVQSRNHNLNY